MCIASNDKLLLDWFRCISMTLIQVAKKQVLQLSGIGIDPQTVDPRT